MTDRDTTEPLLAPELLARLERLQLATRRRLAGRFSGDNRSKRYGTSLDFADYRTYHPGDDFRRIDYNLFARLDQLLLKLFEAEEEMDVHLLVDTSASMASGDKLLYAKRVAAALGFVSLIRRDPVTLHTFPLEMPAPRFSGRASVPAFFTRLTALQPTGQTPFAAAATRLIGRPGLPGLVIVLSDLLTPDWEEGLRRLPARGGDLAVIHVLAPTDLEPDLVGDVDLRDSEDGSRVAASLSPRTLAEYRQAAQAWLDRVSSLAARARAAYVMMRTDVDLDASLFASWQRAGVLR